VPLEDELALRDTAVVFVSLEDETLAEHDTIAEIFDDLPGFSVAAELDFDRATSPLAYTTAYLIDPRGVVREVFPMETYARAPWWAILGEIDRLREDS
jgi:hypothetical protein